MKTKIFHLISITLILFTFSSSMVWAEDPDYSNTPELAETILPYGTHVNGILETDDVDWFKFTPIEITLYRVTLTGEVNKSYKTMDVFQIDEFGNLHATVSQTVWSDATSVKTFFIEAGDDIYIKMSNQPGNYTFNVESIGQYILDVYSDQCSSPTQINVNSPAASGTLTHNLDGTLETDWLYFKTIPLHMYQINLTKSDNTDLNFKLHNENCEAILGWSKSVTVTSWFGEDYKIQISGNASYLGTYYTIEVIDLGLYPDDYASIPENAEPIEPDGNLIEGQIQFNSSYNSDQDWFKFTPDLNTLYQVTLVGEVNKSYKSMEVFQIDEFNNLNSTTSQTTWSDATSVKTFFIEQGNEIYIKLYNSVGNYNFYIENLGQFLPDNYSNDCDLPTQITVNNPPIDGTLTHNLDGSLETDWFYFETIPLHMYQVNLTKSDNTELNFKLHNENCEAVLGWSKSVTVTSWFGEDYKIQVAGNASYLGTYYTIEVIDLGLNSDDYENIANQATNIPKDGTIVQGQIEYNSTYHSDEDWFTFTAGQDGDYDFMLAGELNKSYKKINVLWQDELGALYNKHSTNVWSDAVKYFTVNLPAGKIYLQLYDNLGAYEFYVVSPEPRCGDLDHPYPLGDVNKDCYVNLQDLALMASSWLTCTDPNPPCDD